MILELSLNDNHKLCANLRILNIFFYTINLCTIKTVFIISFQFGKELNGIALKDSTSNESFLILLDALLIRTFLDFPPTLRISTVPHYPLILKTSTKSCYFYFAAVFMHVIHLKVYGVPHLSAVDIPIFLSIINC